MALLERITSMKQQGLSEPQIINNLQQEGISYSQINEAFSQSKIKSAIAGNTSEDETLQQSVMSDATGNQTVGTPESMSQPGYDSPTPQYPQGYDQQYQQQNYPPQQYSPEQYAYSQPATEQQGYYQQSIDLETIRDISRQETDEAVKKIKEQLNSLEKMKIEMRFEMQDIENRLLRVESVINELQSAIIKKIGEYGTSISNISNEIRATQNSFAKIINPVIDKKRGLESQEQPIQQTQQNIPKPQNKPAPRNNNNSAVGVEDYFR